MAECCLGMKVAGAKSRMTLRFLACSTGWMVTPFVEIYEEEEHL